MQLTVRRSVLEAPLLETTQAGLLELRDDDGRLMAVMLFPNAGTFLFSHQSEPGFAAFAREMGFELNQKKLPKQKP